jgi:hypothetical protein
LRLENENPAKDDHGAIWGNSTPETLKTGTMSEPLPRFRRFRWRWLIAVVVSGFLTAAWLLKSDPPRIVFALSNAELLAYRAAGLGQLDHCEQSPAYRWCHQKLTQYAPVFISKRIPALRVTKLWNVKSKTGAESLILFFERQSSSHARNPKLRFADLARLELEDSNGHRYSGNFSRGVPYPDGRDLLCFDSFPRRDRKLIIHVIDRADETKTFRFDIDNPGFRDDFPVWTAEELPQTKSDSAIDVTFRDLDPASVAEGKPLPIEVAVHDPSWERRIVTSSLEDATGNFGGDLSPFETAWKARVTIARTNPALFSPSEQWTVGPFPLPAAGAKMTIGQTKEINGFRLTVQSLEFGKSYTPSGPPRPPVNMKPEEEATADRTFRVDIRRPESAFYLIARVEDQAGQKLTETPQPIPKNPTAVCVRGVRFQPKPDTTHVTLTLIVSQPKEFEFLFPPPGASKPTAR